MFDKITLKKNMSENEFKEIFEPDSEYNSWYKVFHDKPTRENKNRILKCYRLDIRNIKCEYVIPFRKSNRFKPHFKIDGSWSKFDSSENLTNYSILEFMKNYQKISAILGYDISDMIISYLEYGLNVLLKKPTREYLKFLIDHSDTRMRNGGLRDEETKSFENGSRIIKFYDKSKELIRDKYASRELKTLCKQNNFLRFEMRRGKVDIKKFIDEDTTFKFLLDPVIWELLLDDLRKIYNNDILKKREFDGNLLIKSGKDHTNALMMLGKQYMEEKRLDFIYDESLSDSTVSKREKIYRELSKLSFGDTNPLIAELDNAINKGISNISEQLYEDISKFEFYPKLINLSYDKNKILNVHEIEDKLSFVIVNKISGEIEDTLYSVDSSKISLPDTLNATYTGYLSDL